MKQKYLPEMKVCIVNRPAVKDILKGILQAERKWSDVKPDNVKMIDL